MSSPEVREAENFYRQSLALSDNSACGRSWPTVTSALGPYIKAWTAGAGRAALSTAVDLFQSMGMTFWLSRAEALLPHSS